jgi:hypothetical protein
MPITAIQGIVENGQIRFSESVHLPEKATVYVIFPEIQQSFPKRISGPRLARKEDAARFKKIVEDIEELEDAEI